MSNSKNTENTASASSAPLVGGSAQGVQLILSTAKTANESMNQLVEGWYLEVSKKSDSLVNHGGIAISNVPTGQDLLQATLEGKGLDKGALAIFSEVIAIHQAGNLESVIMQVGSSIKDSPLSKVSFERKVAGKFIGLIRARILLLNFDTVTRDIADSNYEAGFEAAMEAMEMEAMDTNTLDEDEDDNFEAGIGDGDGDTEESTTDGDTEESTTDGDVEDVEKQNQVDEMKKALKGAAKKK